MDMSYVKHEVDGSLEMCASGVRDPESTVLDIVHWVVDEAVEHDVGAAVQLEQALSAISYFLEVAPKEVVRAGAERVTRLKNDTDFMFAPFCWGTDDLTDDEKRSIMLKRRPVYCEIHEVLKRAAAR